MLKRIIKLFAFVLVFLGFFAISKAQAQAGELKMHTINIGHGDAHLLESKGHYMLVDSGKKSAHKTLLAYLENHVEGDTIDYVLATHADTDHIGGFASVFKNYTIKNCFYSEPMKPLITEEGEDSNYKKFCDAILNEEGLVYDNAYEGQTWTFGDASVKVIYDGRKGTTYNESSVVIKVACDNKTILMTGDLPTTMETKLMAQKYDFKADILKLGHHGAAASTCVDFLDKINPQYAVIPNGITEKGTFFPKDSVLQRLALKFIKTYLATEGDIVMNIKDDVISTDHPEHKKYECISKGQIVFNKNIFYAPETAGAKVIPTIHVYANGELIPSSGYTVSATKNTHTGVANLKVTGTKKKYVGSLETTFNILPKKTKFLLTKRKGKKLSLKWNSQTYASGYEIVYGSTKSLKKNAKTVIVKGGKKKTKTIKGLSKKKNYYIKIRAFTNNVGYGKWSKVKKIKKIKK